LVLAGFPNGALKNEPADKAGPFAEARLVERLGQRRQSWLIALFVLCGYILRAFVSLWQLIPFLRVKMGKNFAKNQSKAHIPNDKIQKK